MPSSIGVSFGASSDAYKNFRVDYPPELFAHIEKSGANMRHNLAVDLGSGTGLSLPPLLQRFNHVIAVEADARMAEKIVEHAKLEIIVTRAEEFAADAASVDLITCATAFYWMDGPTLIDHMTRWLHPDGLIAVYRYGFPVLPEKLAAIIDRELQLHWNAFRSPRLADEEYTWRCFASRRQLRNLTRKNIPNAIPMTAASLTGFFSSTSYCSAYLRSVENPDAYLAGLQKELESTGTDLFHVDFTVELITASI